MSTITPRSIETDTAYELLSDSRRRHLLSILADEPRSTRADLTRRIAASEQDATAREGAPEGRECVRITLAHDHLPRLADHGVVEYDAASGTVVATDVLEELEPLLERISTTSTTAPSGSVSAR